MQAELLTRDKVKITFENSDLELLNINYRDMDYRSKKIQQIFWRAIYFARDKTGFDPTGFKLLLEAYPARDGGFMLYVTRLCRKDSGSVRGAKGDSAKTCSYIFRFKTLNDLLDCCRLFDPHRVELHDSRLYKNEGAYYLQFTATLAVDDDGVAKLLRNLSEYGDKLTGQYAGAVLDEHCRVVIPSAALAKLKRVAG